MAWYRAGTVNLVNGSAVVTGNGTAFVDNVSVGEGFRDQSGAVYEIASVISATELRLAVNYQGGSANGVAYGILPTQSALRDIADAMTLFLDGFRDVRDQAGKGMFGDGTVGQPGVRFLADPDTGMRRPTGNSLALVTGGVDRVFLDPAGRTGIGSFPGYFFDVLAPSGPYVGRFTNISPSAEEYSVVLFGQGEGGAATGLIGTGGSAVTNAAFRGTFVVGTQNARPLVFATSDNEKMRIAVDGSLTIRGGAGARHLVSSNVPRTAAIMNIEGAPGPSVVFCAVDNYAPNGTSCAMYVARDNATGRSLNATGTLNASGADYAEYVVKADGCGPIAKGDACGVDANGNLTKSWAAAISFAVKSTDPAYVGGDSWAGDLGPRPEGPGNEPPAPDRPRRPGPDASDEEVDRYDAAMAAYPASVAAYDTEKAEWDAAFAKHKLDLAEWEAALEAARQCVDRIAFCGQVPVNVDGPFAVGDYIVAAANGGGIKAVAVKPDEMTLPDYMKRLGKVWAIRDERAWVDVQHG